MNSRQVSSPRQTSTSSLPGALLDRSPRPHRVCDWLSSTDVRDGVGRLSLRLAGLHSLPPELQRDELQLCARISARRLASLIHRAAVSDSQVRKSLLRLITLFSRSSCPSLCSFIHISFMFVMSSCICDSVDSCQRRLSPSSRQSSSYCTCITWWGRFCSASSRRGHDACWRYTQMFDHRLLDDECN